jgi:XRE family transcriptional regulator, regulator of sulfur utilization
MATNQFGIAFGETVQALRAEHRWTQRALAERAGISSGYLSELESGHKEPSATVLADLARSLDIDVPEFLLLIALRALRSPIPPREQRGTLIALIQSLAVMAQSDREDVRDFVEFLAWRAGQTDDEDRRGNRRRPDSSGPSRPVS